jgi:DNA-binding response OmpR family regulator
MDIQMPLMDGYETTRWIREKLRLSLPVIGLSANVYKEEIDQCYEAGMNDYLSKPYTDKSLQEKLAKWITLPASPEASSFSETTGPAEKLTDLSFLNELFNGDELPIREMVKDFTAQQQELIGQMEDALAGQDYKRLSALSHNMRASIIAVGLEALSKPLLKLESLSKEGKDKIGIEEIFFQIKRINQLATEELRATTGD